MNYILAKNKIMALLKEDETAYEQVKHKQFCQHFRKVDGIA